MSLRIDTRHARSNRMVNRAQRMHQDTRFPRQTSFRSSALSLRYDKRQIKRNDRSSNQETRFPRQMSFRKQRSLHFNTREIKRNHQSSTSHFASEIHFSPHESFKKPAKYLRYDSEPATIRVPKLRSRDLLSKAFFFPLFFFSSPCVSHASSRL